MAGEPGDTGVPSPEAAPPEASRAFDWPRPGGRHPGRTSLAWAGILAGAACALAIALTRSGFAALVALLVAVRYAFLLGAWRRLALLEAAEDAARWDPTSPSLNLALAEVRLASGDVPGAVSAFRNAVGLHPDLSLARPEEVAERLVRPPGVSRRRRRALSRLLSAALVMRCVERLERVVGRPSAPASPSGDHLESALGDDAREERGAVLASLRLEMTGVEQLASQIHLFFRGDEEERQRRILGRELAELREHVERLERDVGETGGAQAG